jgi:hypothetical protein
MLTTNRFERLEEELDNASTNVRVEKIAKPPPIFVVRVENFPPFSQLLKLPRIRIRKITTEH